MRKDMIKAKLNFTEMLLIQHLIIDIVPVTP